MDLIIYLRHGRDAQASAAQGQWLLDLLVDECTKWI